jgi:hypothetical protein
MANSFVSPSINAAWPDTSCVLNLAAFVGLARISVEKMTISNQGLELGQKETPRFGQAACG